MGVRQELLDQFAPRDEAVFLTAAKTNQESVRWGFLFTFGRVPPWNEGHDLIPTPEGWRDGKSVFRIRFLDTDSSRDKHDLPARTWSHPHQRRDTPAPACPHTRTRPRARPDARRRPRPLHVGIIERLPFSTFRNFLNLLDL